MNTNLTLVCEVCDEETDCRVGYSNRDHQPLSFACPHCSALMFMTLDTSNAPETGFEFERCHPSDEQRGLFTDHKNPFVDLHLDFPVRFGQYEMGHTPFMMAMQELQASSESWEMAHEKLQFHNQRLNQLNYFYAKSHDVKVIVSLYSGRDKQLFLKKVGEFLGKKYGPSLKPQDVNVALYEFLTFVFLPFVNFGEVKQVAEGFGELMPRLASEPFNQFIRNIVDSGFLDFLQKDCLRIYPEIYEAELPLRPALYLDLLETEIGKKSPARVSTKDFLRYKDLYKDIIEVLSRQLVLVAGINNIIRRQDHNKFATVDGGTLSSLQKFSEKTLSDRFKYLDNCWYGIERSIVETGVRNAIAHNNVDYNEVTQIITYYPGGGELHPSEGSMIYFLDFMRMILVAFRELNNLHHLIKCLFYYEYLVLCRPAPAASTT